MRVSLSGAIPFRNKHLNSVNIFSIFLYLGLVHILNLPNRILYVI